MNGEYIPPERFDAFETIGLLVLIAFGVIGTIAILSITAFVWWLV